MNLITSSNLVSSAVQLLSNISGSWRHLAGPMLIASAILASSQANASSLDMETRVNLQMGLKDYVESRTSDSGYEHFDVATGRVERLTLKNLHPLIFVNGPKYMMCADFLDTDGNDVLLDYIVSMTGNEFRVEQEIPGRRSYLKQLFERVY